MKKTQVPLTFPDNFRSYIVVARTIQTSILQTIDIKQPGVTLQTATPGIHQRVIKVEVQPDSATVIQPGGRMAAQVGHASALQTEELIRKFLLNKGDVDLFTKKRLLPLTRITKVARDSMELYHTMILLTKAGVETYPFHDTNLKAYGHGEFLTVYATEPIDKEEAVGLIDYLPLWNPESPTGF